RMTHRQQLRVDAEPEHRMPEHGARILWPLSQHEPVDLRRRRDQREQTLPRLPELVTLLEHVRHRRAEHARRSAELRWQRARPLQRLGPMLVAEEPKAVLLAVLHARAPRPQMIHPQPAGERRRVAVRAARRHTLAAPPRIERLIAPLDLRRHQRDSTFVNPSGTKPLQSHGESSDPPAVTWRLSTLAMQARDGAVSR